MKIGILTYHRSHNYGALLQAVALKKVIEDVGNEVAYVDYWPYEHDQRYRVVNHVYLKKAELLHKATYICRIAKNLPNIIKRIRSFRKFIDRHIAPNCKSIDSQYECIVYGSDQIWRKEQNLGNKIDKMYLGEGILGQIPKISYAASMGVVNLEGGDYKILYKYLSEFEAVSVREQDLKIAVEKSGIKDVKQVLDPTLLLTKEEWLELLNIKSIRKPGYVLYYSLMPGSFDERQIRKFARERNLEFVPEVMLSLVANADYVFTSSYHGLVFSLIFNKEVFASFRTNAGRAQTLLSSLKIPERLLSPNTRDFQLQKIPYGTVSLRMAELRTDSLTWLKNSLEKVIAF